MEEGPHLVPVSEMAERLGITRERVRQMILEGKLEAVRLGRYWYVRQGGKTRLRQAYTLFTHAGGAGKTSLARDLGYELARRGLRVLLIDTDPQANLTSWLGVREVQPQETLLHLVETGQLPPPRSLKDWNLDLIPASLDLARVEVRLMQRPLATLLLRTALRKEERYDFVLIDSLPSLGHLAALGAMAGDGLLVPVETSVKGVEALVGVMEAAQEYREALEQVAPEAPKTFVRLFIPTKYDARTSGDNRVLERIASLRELAPVASPIAYRPGPHRKATEQAVPIQLVGDRQAREEVERLAEEFLQSVVAKDLSREPQEAGVGQ